MSATDEPGLRPHPKHVFALTLGVGDHPSETVSWPANFRIRWGFGPGFSFWVLPSSKRARKRMWKRLLAERVEPDELRAILHGRPWRRVL